MSYRCEVCGKEPCYGNIVSFSHKRANRRWLPNIQRVRVRHGSNTRRARVCTSCTQGRQGRKGLTEMQGVVKVYDPNTGAGIVGTRQRPLVRFTSAPARCKGASSAPSARGSASSSTRGRRGRPLRRRTSASAQKGTDTARPPGGLVWHRADAPSVN